MKIPLPDEGALFVVTGPSGVGKSTLIKAAMSTVPGLEFSVSATTRPARQGEVDGREYHFVDAERFAVLVAEEAFLEHADVYDRRYGTLKAPVVSAIAAGRSVLLDIDIQGAEQVKLHYPACIRIFVLPPDVAALEERLHRRGTDTEEVRRRRMTQVAQQLKGAPLFDYVVINDDLAAAHAVFQGVLLAELARVHRRRTAISKVLNQL